MYGSGHAFHSKIEYALVNAYNRLACDVFDIHHNPFPVFYTKPVWQNYDGLPYLSIIYVIQCIDN